LAKATAATIVPPREILRWGRAVQGGKEAKRERDP
jgi:hypothetical protein